MADLESRLLPFPSPCEIAFVILVVCVRFCGQPVLLRPSSMPSSSAICCIRWVGLTGSNPTTVWRSHGVEAQMFNRADGSHLPLRSLLKLALVTTLRLAATEP